MQIYFHPFGERTLHIWEWLVDDGLLEMVGCSFKKISLKTEYASIEWWRRQQTTRSIDFPYTCICERNRYREAGKVGSSSKELRGKTFLVIKMLYGTCMRNQAWQAIPKATTTLSSLLPPSSPPNLIWWCSSSSSSSLPSPPDLPLSVAVTAGINYFHN